MKSSVFKTHLTYRAIFLAAGLYVFIDNFALLSPILLSFLLIILVTLALNPLILAVRHFLRRSVATAIAAALFLLIVAGTCWAFYSPLKQPISKFIHGLPEYLHKIEAPLRKLESAGAANGAPDGAFHINFQQILTSLGSGLHAVISNTAAMVIVVVTVFVGTAYMLHNPRPVFAAFFALLPENQQAPWLRIGRRVAVFVPRWALALISGMATVGLLVFGAMWPILGAGNAAMMGVIAFVFESIPYVGAFLAGFPALLLAFGMGGSKPIWVLIAYVAIQLTEHNVIQPLIVAGPLQQHPIWVIFTVMFCLLAFGIFGVLLAVPLIQTIEIIYDELYRPHYLPHTQREDIDRMARHMLRGDQTNLAVHGNGRPADAAQPRNIHPRPAPDR